MCGYGKTALRGCRGRQDDAIDEKFLLGDQFGHARLNLAELRGVSAEGVEYTGVVHQKLNVVAVLHGGVFAYDLNFVVRSSINKRQHGGYQISQCVRRWEAIRTFIQSRDLALQCYQHFLRGFVRSNILRIIIGYAAAVLKNGVNADIFRDTEILQTAEKPVQLVCYRD